MTRINDLMTKVNELTETNTELTARATTAENELKMMLAGDQQKMKQYNESVRPLRPPVDHLWLFTPVF